jgi:hypothetical protein
MIFIGSVGAISAHLQPKFGQDCPSGSFFRAKKHFYTTLSNFLLCDILFHNHKPYRYISICLCENDSNGFQLNLFGKVPEDFFVC